VLLERKTITLQKQKVGSQLPGRLLRALTSFPQSNEAGGYCCEDTKTILEMVSRKGPVSVRCSPRSASVFSIFYKSVDNDLLLCKPVYSIRHMKGPTLRTFNSTCRLNSEWIKY